MPRQARIDAPGALHLIIVRGINPATTFIANHNASFYTCLFGYHVSVPGYELRVACC